jgi:hypothetical protein
MTNETSIQSSKLLSSLFENVSPGRRLAVLHVGPALQETIEFFSSFRCRVHFVDLFSELPIASEDEQENPCMTERFSDMMAIRQGTLFDICLFWDLFNFLDSQAVVAFVSALRPHLHSTSLAHGFSVHNLRSPQGDQLYSINELGSLNVRHRKTVLPGYAPHGQSQLQTMLNCFNFDRSVLLPDSRLELLFSSKT